MTKQERLHLNELSKNLYGASSRWKKMVDKGEVTTLTRKLEDGTEQKYLGISRYTVEEVKKTMEELWAEELVLKEKHEKEAKERSEKATEEVKETVEENKTEEIVNV